ncbi:EboA domain-containing protein [Stratiformator vulcanicus]|uniref:Uncharacterized protein n=1 Tax=Stratiformator vulcanicus TaxID=2527980 RepID=A0A517R2U6_9PLAN|nr:EboA domain-containing protein [Stratiformator vulcanicus]QDT38206.1 hypothetical protein Pan189_25960 [Stratiformator vulcanicus]
MGVRTILNDWLKARLDERASDWLEAQTIKIAGGNERALYLAFGMAPRKVGKADLTPSDEEIAAAAEAYQPEAPAVGELQGNASRLLAPRACVEMSTRDWSLDQTARTLLVLSFPADDADRYVSVLGKLYEAGEVRELCALYQMLPLLPHPERHVDRCVEGIRTNMLPVFKSIAHRNPYPAAHLPEASWNQLVLKCLFVGEPLYPIIGLDERANPDLAKMLHKYALERWAAKREVNPELWRCVGPHADEAARGDLERLADSGSELEQASAEMCLGPDGSARSHSWDERWSEVGREFAAGSQ